ncbi:MAG: hypothetical protein KBB71_00235 [Lentimicrobiaceae bacterium]|nr:hypothetical protein [Lentimicrobiaceae bacterium]
MNKFLHTIFRLLLALVPALLAVQQARAQGDTVCAGGISTWVVEATPGVTYTWELYNDVTGLNLAVTPGNCPASEAYFVGGVNTGSTVEVMCLVPGTYFIKVTATDSCTNNLKLGRIEVLPCLSYAVFLPPEPICEGDQAYLTVEIAGGIGPWTITYTDGTNSWTIENITESPYTFPLIPCPTVTTSYWITSLINGYGLVTEEDSDPVIQVIYPKPVTSPIYRYTPMGKK